MSWTPQTWRNYTALQQPEYADPARVEQALAEVRALPPLVAPGEVRRLREQLARAEAGGAFLLQGGDCAERFEDCSQAAIESKLKILLQMSLVLTWGARLPVVRVGRIAGQYAKPRSRDRELVGEEAIAAYRGDHVNDIRPARDAREPDPDRMVRAYFHSAATLNYVRALLAGGFADLHQHHDWDLGFVRDPERRARYEQVDDRIEDVLAFMKATGLEQGDALRRVDFFSSHEGLLLAYEEAQTVPVDGSWYNLGAHMLWIGERTRQLEGAHVEYFRGIENPIGVKLGPDIEGSELLRLLDRLEPENRPGRVTLIVRQGLDNVTARLPALVRAVQAAGRSVVWSSDPMHGNTTQTESGLKTRDCDRILGELSRTFDVLEAEGTSLGGVHLELTGDDVTECTGGAGELSETDLSRNYATYCDPRLNHTQSLEMAMLLAERLGARRRRR